MPTLPVVFLFRNLHLDPATLPVRYVFLQSNRDTKLLYVLMRTKDGQATKSLLAPYRSPFCNIKESWQD